MPPSRASRILSPVDQFAEREAADEKVVAIPSSSVAEPGMAFQRYFTDGTAAPLDAVRWEKRRSVITEPSGKIVFEADDVEVPADWSQLATDIAVSKYFRKAGVPGSGGERSVRQLVDRVSYAIRTDGERRGYFRSAHDAQIFSDELSSMLVNQLGACNSPVWFNCGLSERYGIQGSGGNYHWNEEQAEIVRLEDSYLHPQCSACFIQSVKDDLMNIFTLLGKEARVFKYGSGSGTNFSTLRSSYEHLSGGGTSSGVMSFLEVFDKGAGATKSGGTTRRAAKMVCLDLDHPEILDFIRWKAREEKKAKMLIAQGLEADFNGEAYHTVSGQNSNNSVRIPDLFMRAVEADGEWSTRLRTSREIHKTYPARELMHEIAQAAWACADPGVQFDDTINHWHTCANTDRIYASNPCSEFMFLDDTACNLASLNLTAFFDLQKNRFDIEAYRRAIRVFITAMDILVDYSSYPTAEIAQNSHNYRPLGLGYANLGSLLMLLGVSYDSEEGRGIAAALTSLLCGEAYAVSAELAQRRRPFSGFKSNREPMLRVIRQHREAAEQLERQRCPQEFHEAALGAWRQAEELGKLHGYRNSQVTVLAPTGTIGLLMDCDTTGVEPDYSLVKWKKLAGGGYVKMVNRNLPLVLERLGYDSTQCEQLMRWVIGRRSLDDTRLDPQHLRGMGFAEEEIQEAEASVRQQGELNSFTPHINPASLRERGLKEAELVAAQREIGGWESFEGAPGFRSEHLPIFDCANRCGPQGQRFLKPLAHVRMVAAVQPFISGAISKTINMPESTTVEEIEQLYTEAWRMGLKAVALYRDNSKGSQPLRTQLDSSASAAISAAGDVATTAVTETLAALKTNAWRERRELPARRRGVTLEASVGGHKIFLRTGEYENGELGEIFIDMYKEGAAYRSMMNSFAQAVSAGLQHGVPLEKYVKMFTFTRFEPHGMTDHPNLRTCTSILDFIFRILAMDYLGRMDFIHVPPQVTLNEDQLELPSSTDSPVADMPGQAQNLRHPPSASATALPTFPPSAPQRFNASVLDTHLAEMMGDAPACDQCGHLTVRNGACYRCLNCGNSIGCS